jgi:molecular chaperone DnaJ
MTCGGSGRVRGQQGFFIIEQTCQACKGTGSIIKDPCKRCNGEGRIEKPRTTEINIPPGIGNHDRLRIISGGEAGLYGGETGDLYIIINVKEHRLYKRQGDDLKCEVPVKMVTATIGGNIEIPSINGTIIKVTIPEGTQSGTELKIKERGMPTAKNPKAFGNLFIKITVETPTSLSKKQKDLLEEFDKECKGKTSPETTTFFKKIKDFFQG